MVKSLNILFYIRKDKADSGGNAPIYCRITVNGKRSEFAIKRTAPIDRWVSGSEIVKGYGDECKALNAYIDTVRHKVYEHHAKLELQDKLVTAEAIKNNYLGITDKPRSLFALFKNHNKKVEALIGKEYAYGTFERYQTTLKHLKEFVERKYGRSDINVTEVDNEFLVEFDYFLRSEHNCANNTTVKYLKNFKKIIKIALANGWILRDPYVNFNPKLKKVDRGYLTEEELEKIKQKRFDVLRLQQIKDIFVFQCYTGLAYADIKLLSPENIIKGNDGELWISTHRKKTNTPVNVPLLPEAIAVLNRYKAAPECLYKNAVLPVISNQKMNAYLAEIGTLCGITKRVTSHLARHTFATTVTLAHGVSIEAVSRMLGHTNIKTTQIYARMMDKRVGNEMKLLKGILEKDECNQLISNDKSA